MGKGKLSPLGDAVMFPLFSKFFSMLSPHISYFLACGLLRYRILWSHLGVAPGKMKVRDLGRGWTWGTHVKQGLQPTFTSCAERMLVGTSWNGRVRR